MTFIPDTRCLTIIVVAMPPFASLLGVRFTSVNHRWALLGCSQLQMLARAVNVLTWTVMTASFGGHTKRSVANGVRFLFFGAENIIGSNIFFDDEAPRYSPAITGLLVCYAGIKIVAACVWGLMLFDNRRRDRTVLLGGGDKVEGERQAILGGIQDRTGKESPWIRYRYEELGLRGVL